MSLEHAKHNEDFCYFLLENGKFFDWVVIGAFYSALKYVQSVLIPCEHKGKTFTSFEDWWHGQKVEARKHMSKHRATIRLVAQYCPGTLAAYRWLFDACMSARYQDHLVGKGTAEQAANNLMSLKGELLKQVA